MPFWYIAATVTTGTSAWFAADGCPTWSWVGRTLMLFAIIVGTILVPDLVAAEIWWVATVT